MSHSVTMHDLKHALEIGSGVDWGVDLDRDLPTKTFNQLGYDSLAVLETGLRLGRDHDVTIDDEVFTDLETPQQLLDAVNQALDARVAS